ncbi:hypothetical protein BS17DRAFT_786579, partial [Gyrodon lividus]
VSRLVFEFEVDEWAVDLLLKGTFVAPLYPDGGPYGPTLRPLQDTAHFARLPLARPFLH